jgi:hypothetical protein
MGFVIFRVISAALLLLALRRNDLGDDYLIKFVTCVICFYGACLAWQWKRVAWTVAFGAFALLFLPLIRPPIGSLAWNYLAVGAGIFLIATIFLFRERTIIDAVPVSSAGSEKMTFAEFVARLSKVNEGSDPAILRELYDEGVRYRDEAGVGANHELDELLEALANALPSSQTNK